MAFASVMTVTSSHAKTSVPEVSKEQFLHFVGSREPDNVDERVRTCWCQQLVSLQQNAIIEKHLFLLGIRGADLREFHKLACTVCRILGNLPDTYTKEFHDVSEKKAAERLSRTFSHLKLFSNNNDEGPCETLSKFGPLSILMNMEKFRRLLEVAYQYSVAAPFDGVKNRFACSNRISLQEKAEEVDTYLENDGARITLLDCVNLKLPFFPSELCMPYLQQLYLGGNSIASLPSSVHVFVDLKILTLDDNLLSDLPADLAKCQQLGTLSLSKNSFISLPEVLWRLGSLRILDLSYNHIKDLSRIGELTNLQVLSVAHNKIKTLPQSIGQLKWLVKLDISNNKLTTLPEAINGLDSVKSLYMHGNEISSVGLSDKNCQKLEKVSVSSLELIELFAKRKCVSGIWVDDVSVTDNLIKSCKNKGTTLGKGVPPEVSYGEELYQKRKITENF